MRSAVIARHGEKASETSQSRSRSATSRFKLSAHLQDGGLAKGPRFAVETSRQVIAEEAVESLDLPQQPRASAHSASDCCHMQAIKAAAEQ